MACCASSAFGSSAAARGRRKAARYRTSSRRRSTSSSNLSPRGGIPIEVPGSAHGCRAQARRLDVQKARAHPAARPPPSAPFRRALRVGSMLPNPLTHARAVVDASPRARQTKISMSLVPGPESLRDAGRSGGEDLRTTAGDLGRPLRRCREAARFESGSDPPARLTAQTDRRSVHAHHPHGAVRVRSAQRHARAPVGPAHEQRPVHTPRPRGRHPYRMHASNE